MSIQALSHLLPAAAWTLLAGCVWTGGDLLLRSWLHSRWEHGFALSFAVIITGTFFWMLGALQQNIAIAAVAAVLINVIGYIVAAHFLYGDTLGLLHGVAITVGLIVIAVLQLA